VHIQEQTENNIIPFTFEGMALKESCWIEGVPHFTYRAIGEFLEYKEAYNQIRRLVARNPYILRYQTTVNLTVVEGTKNVTRKLEVVHPIGMQCIFFESHQPAAIKYKVATASLIWAIASGVLKPSKWAQKGDLISAARQILSLPEGKKRSALVVDLAVQEGVTTKTVYGRILKATGERLKTRKGKPRKMRYTKGTTKYGAERERVYSFIKEHPEYLVTGNQHKNYYKKDIKGILGLVAPSSQVCSWIREAAVNN